MSHLEWNPMEKHGDVAVAVGQGINLDPINLLKELAQISRPNINSESGNGVSGGYLNVPAHEARFKEPPMLSPGLELHLPVDPLAPAQGARFEEPPMQKAGLDLHLPVDPLAPAHAAKFLEPPMLKAGLEPHPPANAKYIPD